MNDIVNQPIKSLKAKSINKNQDVTECNGVNYIPLFFEEITQESNQQNLSNYSQYKSNFENTIAVCLTAYNEDLSAYKSSLSGLARASQYFHSKDYHEVSSSFLICILVDGLDAMDGQFAKYAINLGMYDPDKIDNAACYHLFESSIPRILLDDLSNDHELVNYTKHQDLQKVLLIIKNKNHGKLHSHKCFFDIACKLYLPDFFLQIDVGTTPEPDAIYQMWKHLYDNPNIAATAARSHLPSPDKSLNLLMVWQFCDIALERVVNWPTEILMGNLSVLPGQLSLTRMQSVMGENSVNSQAPKVLDNYYKGLDSLSPLESNMYLAEDRILGLEMVFQDKNQWELNYASKAEATVDSCQSWGELLKQRRRWICSSIACRISMLARLPIIFNNHDRSFLQQVHKTVAGIYSIIFSTFCWFVPVFYLAIQTSLFIASRSKLESIVAGYGITALYIAALTFFISQIFISFKRKISGFHESIIAIGIYVQSLHIAICSFLIIYHHQEILAGEILISVFLAMIVGYCLLGLLYSRKLFIRIVKNIIPYSLSRPVITSLLMFYSILNCHDTSWGTKGLESVNGQTTASQDYKSFRNKVASLFLITNILAFIAIFYSGSLNTVWPAIVIISLTLIQIIIAFSAFFINKFSTYHSKDFGSNVIKVENKIS